VDRKRQNIRRKTISTIFYKALCLSWNRVVVVHLTRGSCIRRRIRIPSRIAVSSNRPAPWNIVLFEKLIVTELVKKFPAFYGIRRIITVFTRACH
jgi:hypothetical protein